MRRRFAGLLAASLVLCGRVAAQGIPDLDGFDRGSTEQGSTILIPDGRSKTKRPALILLPFTGGSARDLLERWYSDSLPKQARELGFIVVVPTPLGSADDYGTGAAWTATLNRYTRDIAADAKELVARFDTDPNRIAVAGYSLGGDLAWALIQRNPELYSGAVVMGSRASYRDAGGLKRFAQRGGRVSFFMGNAESDSRRSGARAALDAAKRAGITPQYLTGPGEHVPAPPRVFADGVEFALGYRAGMSSPAAETRPQVKAGPARPATSTKIVEKLPGCDWQPYEDAKSEKYGYKDARGRIVVPPRFDYAEEFHADGLAGVHEKGDWHYLTCAGKSFPVVAVDNGPDPFRSGLARFREHGRTGYVNRRGEIVIPARFESGGMFCRGIAAVGSDCHTEQVGEHSIARCRTTGYIDTSGREIPEPDDPPPPAGCADLPPVAAMPSGKLKTCDWKPFRAANGLYGYRDARGRTTMAPQFDVAREFGPDGIAKARVGDFGVGYATCEGRFFEVFYDGGWDEFREGLVRVEGADFEIGYADMRGNLVIAPRFDFGTPFCNGAALVGDSCSMERDADKKLIDVGCGTWKFIDKTGREVAEENLPDGCEEVLVSPGYEDSEYEEE